MRLEKNLRKATWERLDDIVRQWIYGTISNDLLNTIIHQQDTAVCRGLGPPCSSFQTKSAKALASDAKFTNTKLVDFPNVKAYRTRLKVLADNRQRRSQSPDQRLVLRLARYAPTAIDQAMHTMSLNPPDDKNWYMDTGATSHMTNSQGTLSSYYQSSKNNGIVVGNGSMIPIRDCGHASLQCTDSDSLEPKDIKFTAPSLEFSSTSPGTKEAPLVTYIKLHECNKFSIGIFCLPPSGVIPLHNHPGMTVFSKLLLGTMHAKSYDWVQNRDQFNQSGRQEESGMRLAEVHVDADFTAPCNASVLFPDSGGNIHCFKALTPCILLDVLGPPYYKAEGRHYYQDYTYDTFSDVKELKLTEDGTRYAWLEERNEQFVMLGGTYDGPTIKV
ncbi:uncharacterized protein LOC132057540 [Lycium ferocissimum]|uniref:uncharacterized protein LOC132057540 n=1 Tax=Lycium ferocissimum TaxID=112874 RepID=UPI0028156716|nr:uncharacterized protein LOC132057540 [Lycium ferocissimum]